MFVDISEFYWIFASGIVLVMTSQNPTGSESNVFFSDIRLFIYGTSFLFIALIFLFVHSLNVC